MQPFFKETLVICRVPSRLKTMPQFFMSQFPYKMSSTRLKRNVPFEEIGFWFQGDNIQHVFYIIRHPFKLQYVFTCFYNMQYVTMQLTFSTGIKSCSCTETQAKAFLSSLGLVFKHV